MTRRCIAGPAVTRRRFVQSVAAGGLVAAAPPWQRVFAAGNQAVLSGTEFRLEIGAAPINITGRPMTATTINGTVPGPILRWREGDTVTLWVTNHLAEPTSIHWHGILVPNPMDGVPGLTFPGIAPGETFVYRIPVRQNGTYWYHSHSKFQLQTGQYAPLIIEPKDGYPQAFDRDYVVMLSDWSDENPETIVANLKMQSDYYNFGQRTLGTFIADVARDGLQAAIEDRMMWGEMRMDPTDILDINGATYTYLVNGQPPAANWTALFRPGERVRLRFVNGSMQSIFDVRIPDLPMTIVQADGQDVDPVTVEQFRFGSGETYDAIVQPRADRAFTIFAQAEDRSGFTRGTLAPRPGMAGPIPPMDPRPLRTMADMGMEHGAMGHGSMGGMNQGSMPGIEHGAMGHGSMGGMSQGSMPGTQTKPGAMSGMDHAAMGHSSMGSMSQGSMPGMDHGAMGHGAMGGMNRQARRGMRHRAMHRGAMRHGSMNQGSMPGMQMDHGSMPRTDHGAMPGMEAGRGSMTVMDQGSMAGMNHGSMPGMAHGSTGAMSVSPFEGPVGVDNIAMMPQERLNDPGGGIPEGRRVLRYTDLRHVKKSDDPRPPAREITLHLTGNMERFIWGIDGKKFSEAGPILLKAGERVRFTLINDTMMEHPMHLHGHFSELENGQGEYRPYKHTIIVKGGERLSFLFTAEAGRWAFHCHLNYHMEAGMFREVRIA